MTEIEAPDGSIVEFPDGTPDDVIIRAMKQAYPAPAAAQPAPEDARGVPAAAPAPATPAAEPSMADMIMDGAGAVGGVLDQGARGVAEGVTNILGLPRMLMEGKNYLVGRGLSAVGVPEDTADFIANLDPSRFLLPSAEGMQHAGDSVNNAIADTVGVNRPQTEPDNVAERFSNRIGQEIGAGGLMAGGVLGKAASMRAALGEAAPAAARSGGKLSQMFIEPAVVNPGTYLGKEMSAATAAGAGAATANEVFPDSPYADLAGAVLGVGGASLGGKAVRSIGEMGKAVMGSPGYVDDVVRNSVADRLVEAAGVRAAPGQAPDTTDLVNSIMDGPRIDQQIPGARESLADRTRNPGIGSLEYSRQSGPNAGEFNARRQQNARAVDTAISANAPDGNPANLRSELALERDRQITDASTLATNAQDDAARAVEPITPKGTASMRGNTVRAALEEARDAARARTSAAYQNADITGQPIEAEGLINAIDSVTSRMPQADQANLPEALIGRLQRLGDDPATMAEATALRSELQQMGVAASKKPGGRNEARVLGQVEAAVDDFIFGNLPSDQQGALREARAARHAEGSSFDRVGDPVQRALAQNDAGYKLGDENVAKSFTRTQAMDRLFQEADTPETRAAIRDEMLTSADTSRADKLQSFIDTNSEQIERFPGLRDELSQVAKARGDEATAAARKTDLERTLGTDEKPGRSTVGKYLQYSDANSDKAIREVLSAKDPKAAADELLTFVGDDPAAVQGARKALWENMSKAARRTGETTKDVTGAQEWMPEKLKNWLADPRNREVAERFYKDDPEHITNLQKIADALQGLDLRNSAKVPNNSGTAQSALPSVETLGSMGLAYKRGQIGPAFIVTRLGAVIARRSVKAARAGAIEKMLDDALLNPDAAALLLKENNPANRAALARRAKTWFGAEAAKIMNALSADDETDMEKAVNGR
ncbi:hypothetical protein OEG84_11425 [Hoeflea sp. G2-23]|uniref:DdrB-like domain-containing protein n=1 Tax=Hoeflea algicola TaxID=2983763 RepID=A0ABT3Z961_9HYPH|nr:hypothetical protein [Hoeflea algicola]MCY0148303.1 hypothetical protein [Hoeflea algicola]